jgi:uncharacterized Fe-S cluster-containing radical SAM superfamily protein
MDLEARPDGRPRPADKFQDPDWTAAGEPRASVPLTKLKTIWFNTGTLCNITCRNCYIDSSPTNDRLVYLSARDVEAFLDEIERDKLGTELIGFTGGEPFLNPEFLAMLGTTLKRGFDVLALTNAMQPMQRPRIRDGLLRLLTEHGDRLLIRVSLDHYTRTLHETERGPKSFDKTLKGIDWLSEHGFNLAIAGRTCWGEAEAAARAGYAALIAKHGWRIDAGDHDQLFLLPEMDGSHDVPEITNRCWAILNKDPGDLMCASSRMIVKRKGAEAPTVLPCTLLPYDTSFEMGPTLKAAQHADSGMFAKGRVKLCHPHCAKFCVLGGGSCS